MQKTMTVNKVACAIISLMLTLAVVPTYAFADDTNPRNDPEYINLLNNYSDAVQELNQYESYFYEYEYFLEQYSDAEALYNSNPSDENFEALIEAEMNLSMAESNISYYEDKYNQAKERLDAAEQALTTYRKSITASGTWGTCAWDIQDGVLTIHEGEGAPTPKDPKLSYGFSPWNDYCDFILKVTTDGTVVLPSDSSYLFGYGIGHSSDGGFQIIEADLSGFDTSQVKYMGGMFNNCGYLTTLDLTGWDTSNVTSMYNMFEQCSRLEKLDLSNLDTSSVTNMRCMFEYCRSLHSLNLGGKFDTSNVTNMQSMFDGCSSLTELDLSHLDTSSVTNMKSMFEDCSALSSLDLSNFNTSNVTDMGGMFRRCTNLSAINISDSWDTSNVVSSVGMFYNCTSLVGGNGTPYDSSFTNKTYATADTAETPGYLTHHALKNNNTDTAGSTITIETEASTINVTVPTNAAFVFKADGTNVYPSNYEVMNNNGLTAITLDAIDFEGVNGWSLTTEDDTFQADVKKFALKMGLKDSILSVVDKDNGVSFAGDTEIKIAPQSSKVLGFEAVRGVFSEPVTTENAMQMTMHFDWEHAA